MEEQDLRYAPPKTRVEDITQESQAGQLAPRLTRLCAVLVDVAIVLAVMGIVSVVTPLDVWGLHHIPGWWEMLLRALIGMVLFMAIHGYLLATRGQTVGKALFKIRIARVDGSQPAFLRLVALRYGVQVLLSTIPTVGVLFSLADPLFIFGTPRRCLHDLIADTVVLRV